MLNAFLDKTVFFSFDRSGFLRHQKTFDESRFDGSGKTALITGGNSGIGFQIARDLLRAKAKVILLCRSEKRGRIAVGELIKEFPKGEVKLSLVDLSEQGDLKKFLSTTDLSNIDILVNNAGQMPIEKQTNSEGQEIIWQTQVVGHFRLAEALVDQRKSPTRIVTISSGGMYTLKLNLDDLNWEKRSYDHYKAYANAKRAQVILNEMWHEKYGEKGFLFSCMHPGWVDTPGVEKSMPTFYRWMQNRLRTPEEGADTAVWLALTQKNYSGGKFWFDRKQAATQVFPWTKETDEDRKRLWKNLSSSPR